MGGGCGSICLSLFVLWLLMALGGISEQRPCGYAQNEFLWYLTVGTVPKSAILRVLVLALLQGGCPAIHVVLVAQ